jgi:CAAX protease family protein
MRDATKRGVLIAAPPVLTATMFVAFQLLTRVAGLKAGYFLGFIFYWILWCVGIPLVVLGADGVFALFRMAPPERRLRRSGWLAVVLPLTLGFGYAFPRAAAEATPQVVLLSFLIALVNAPLEELLWRGTYVSVFPSSPLYAYWYPNVAFGLWHVAPLSVVPSRAPGGMLAFVLVSSAVGLLWGRIVIDTRSIRLTSVVHTLFDFSGLGGRLYA